MRSLTRFSLTLLLLPGIAAAKDAYLPITGSVGVFRTDARIFNPSGTKDITINATFLPAAGNPAPSTTVVRTITKRQMLVLNDVVAALFGASGLGAIKLSSADDFIATARIYASAENGTLGQFSIAVDQSAAKNKGVVIQLRSNGAPGQIGTFRANLGFVNVGSAPANVTLRLFDKNNMLVGSPLTISPAIPVNGVLSPGNYFANVSGDFSDAWVSYESDQPLIAYGSVIDNGTTDATFVPAFDDTGTSLATAKDAFLPITGSVGVFRTDARIFNPSGTRDIAISATFLPAAGNPAASTTVQRVIPRRQMLVLNDVVAALFGASGLGAIKLSSADQFIATARIYATAENGTLGQFSIAVDGTGAKKKGVVIQLRSNGAPGQVGTFRANLGFVNVGSAPANVVLRLYDRNNAPIGAPLTISPAIPVNGVLSPGNYFANVSGDFSDAWVSYESDQPLIAYGSVIDNGTTDATFVPAFEDIGTPAPQPTTKIFNVTARTSEFVVQEGSIRVNLGDEVIIRVTGQNTTHGFALTRYAPGGITVSPGQTKEIRFTADKEGCFTYSCTVPSCSPGHFEMVGTMTVGTCDVQEPPPCTGYYCKK